MPQMRKVNIAAIRDVLDQHHPDPATPEVVAAALGVLPSTLTELIPYILAEQSGVKVLRNPRGRIVGLRRWKTDDGADWKERPVTALESEIRALRFEVAMLRRSLSSLSRNPETPE